MAYGLQFLPNQILTQYVKNVGGGGINIPLHNFIEQIFNKKPTKRRLKLQHLLHDYNILCEIFR
jgi:hypothetical protein